MKQLRTLLPLATLLLAALPTAAAPSGLCSTPAEYGLAPLDFSHSPTAPQPSELHDWQLPDAAPLRARLLHILSYGEPQARAVLLTPDGRQQALPLRDMQPADRSFADEWLQSRGFIELPLCIGGSLCARVTELRESSLKRPFPFLEIRLMTPDGRPHPYCCNAQPITEAEARQNRIFMPPDRPSIYFTAEGLERLRQARPSPKTAAAPILLASNPREARSYATLHGLTVVTVYLNRRGSEIALAWKEYLRRYPEAGSCWNDKYVFVGIHCDERGHYPAELLREIQACLPPGTGDMKPPAALHTGGAYKGVPDFFSVPAPPEGCNSIADFLNTPPSQIHFGR